MPRMDTKKDIIICDLDGTLANEDHRAGLYRTGIPEKIAEYYELCSLDTPNYEICNLVRKLSNFYEIWIMSYRLEKVAEKTEMWLSKNMVPYDRLFLAKLDSNINSGELKLKWAEPIKDRVAFILEDRQRIVDAWRAAGYTCLQVAPGNF